MNTLQTISDKKSGTLALICELMDMNLYEMIRGMGYSHVHYLSFKYPAAPEQLQKENLKKYLVLKKTHDFCDTGTMLYQMSYQAI